MDGKSELDDVAKTAIISGVILKILGIRTLAPVLCKLHAIVRPKLMLTGVAKAKKSVPHEGIQLECLNVALDSLLRVIVSVPQLSLETVNRCGIWKVLSSCLGMLV